MNNNIYFIEKSENIKSEDYDLIFFLIGDNQFVENYKPIFQKLDETFLPQTFKIAIYLETKDLDKLVIFEKLKEQDKPIVFFTNKNEIKEKLFQIEFENTVILTPQISHRSPNKQLFELIKKMDLTQQREISILGYQSYYSDNLLLEELKSKDVECFRLAEVQKDLLEIEPFLREANFLYIDICSIRNNELQAVINSLPSGFNSIEICKIFHYFGLSTKNQLVYIDGYDAQKDNQKQGAIQIAQYLWHFITSLNLKEQYLNQQKEYEINIVEKKGLTQKIKFKKCTITERWWFEDKSEKWHTCSYLDFLNAQKGILSNRLAKYLVR